jgi:hypothetical protein
VLQAAVSLQGDAYTVSVGIEQSSLKPGSGQLALIW